MANVFSAIHQDQNPVQSRPFPIWVPACVNQLGFFMLDLSRKCTMTDEVRWGSCRMSVGFFSDVSRCITTCVHLCRSGSTYYGQSWPIRSCQDLKFSQGRNKADMENGWFFKHLKLILNTTFDSWQQIVCLRIFYSCLQFFPFLPNMWQHHAERSYI